MIELTSAQRAFLRSQAQTIEPVVMVGKDGMGDNVGRALDEALSCHELVKVRFQAHKDEVKDIARELESFTGSTLVSTTGFTAVFYRQSDRQEKRRYNLKTFSVKDI